MFNMIVVQVPKRDLTVAPPVHKYRHSCVECEYSAKDHSFQTKQAQINHESNILLHLRKDGSFPPFSDGQCLACSDGLVQAAITKFMTEKKISLDQTHLTHLCTHEVCYNRSHSTEEALRKHLNIQHPCTTLCAMCSKHPCSIDKKDKHQNITSCANQMPPQPVRMQMDSMVKLLDSLVDKVKSDLDKYAQENIDQHIDDATSVCILIDKLIGSIMRETKDRIDFESACINALKQHHILHENTLLFTKNNQQSNISKCMAIESGLHLSDHKFNSLLSMIGAPLSFKTELNHSKLSYLKQFDIKINEKDKFAMVKPTTLIDFILTRDNLKCKQEELILKFDIDANVITKTRQHYQNMAFEIISPKSSVKDSNSPYNSHIFLVYKFRESDEESNSALKNQLQEVRKEIEDLFKTKELVIGAKSIIKFKDVLISSDLHGWVRLIGLGSVYHPKAKYICPICNVSYWFVKKIRKNNQYYFQIEYDSETKSYLPSNREIRSYLG
jgi:hypothetical protein